MLHGVALFRTEFATVMSRLATALMTRLCGLSSPRDVWQWVSLPDTESSLVAVEDLAASWSVCISVTTAFRSPQEVVGGELGDPHALDPQAVAAMAELDGIADLHQLRAHIRP